MVEDVRNGVDSDDHLGGNQTVGNVNEAVDMMIDATLKIMEEAGGDVSKPDRGPVLHDLVTMLDDRLAQAESEEVSAERAAGLRAARDRAAERYRGETGLVWERRAE